LLQQCQSDLELPEHVLDSLTAEVAVLNKDGEICAVNEAWLRFARENGGSVDATGLGVNYLDICRSSKGDDSLFAERACLGIEKVLAGARRVFQLEYPCHSPLRRRWFLLYVSRLKGAPQHAVTVHLCITDRKMVENQLVESERLAAIGEAMQGLSHTGRNVLQQSQGHIDLLKTKLDSDQEALRLVEGIELAQSKLLSLYEEVQAYAAPITLSRESCQLADFIKEVGSNYESRAPQASFSYQPDGTGTICDIDRGLIRRVIHLLIDNALASGATLVEFSYSANDLDGRPALTLVVSDNGAGVSRDDRKRVFEPFYTTKAQGTGLGLAVGRRIVSMHGGQIYLGTPRHGGTSVFITLPARRVEHSP
jgi:signal transduction histidine kinase